MLIVYYSGKTGATQRFVDALGYESVFRITPESVETVLDKPYVLITPTYADGQGHHAIPPLVRQFLELNKSTALLRGVVGTGNRSFGATYCLAARKISKVLTVPLLHTLEMSGMPHDVDQVKTKIGTLSC